MSWSKREGNLFRFNCPLFLHSRSWVKGRSKQLTRFCNSAIASLNRRILSIPRPWIWPNDPTTCGNVQHWPFMALLAFPISSQPYFTQPIESHRIFGLLVDFIDTPLLVFIFAPLTISLFANIENRIGERKENHGLHLFIRKQIIILHSSIFILEW